MLSTIPLKVTGTSRINFLLENCRDSCMQRLLNSGSHPPLYRIREQCVAAHDGSIVHLNQASIVHLLDRTQQLMPRDLEHLLQSTEAAVFCEDHACLQRARRLAR